MPLRNILTVFIVLSVVLSHPSLFAVEREMLDRVASVSISSGDPESIGEVTVRDNDVEIVSRRADGGGPRKFYWRLAKDTELVFTVHLPVDAEDVSARILMDASVKKQGEAALAWNGRVVGEEDQPYVLRSGGKGRDVRMVYFDDHKPENQLKLTGTKGEIDIDAVEFRYRIPCPAWEQDGVRLTLLSPEPHQEVAKTDGVSFRWTATGPMEKGWLKIEYKDAPGAEWKPVPGAEGLSYGDKEWPTESGSYHWAYDGSASSLEFRMSFSTGPNPLVEQRNAELKRQTEAKQSAKKLFEIKHRFLSELKDHFDTALWIRSDREGQRTAVKLLPQIAEELKKPDADFAKLEEWLTQTDTAISSAYAKIFETLSAKEDTDVKVWKDFLTTVELYLTDREGIMKECHDAIADSAEMKELVSALFPDAAEADRGGRKVWTENVVEQAITQPFSIVD